MLKTLSIKNYALIEELNVNFDEGFSIITGETGAGKSILLGALGLILGKRADSSVLSDNNKKCKLVRTELYPNMNNKMDYPWNHFKKQFAEKLKILSGP